VLRVWAEGDGPTEGAPIDLLKVGADDTGKPTLTSLSRHSSGASADRRFEHAGQLVDLIELVAPDPDARDRDAQDRIVEAAGLALYRRLSPGAVGAALEALDVPCRVLLDLRSASLHPLPWELARGALSRLFLGSLQAWSRGSIDDVRVSTGLQAVDANPVLRVLVVVGTERRDKAAHGDAELRDLEDRLHPHAGRLIVRVLVRPKPESVTSAFANFQPHVFHFIGHGDASGGRTVLNVYSEELKKTESWEPDRLIAALQGGAVPRLVVLNACDTATPSASWDLTSTFLAAGVNAVVGMQGAIEGGAAKIFSRHLFERLISGEPIDVAVAAARNHLATNGSASERPQWPLPRLVVRGCADGVLPSVRRTAGSPPPVRAREDFVGRFTERCKAWETLCPLRGGRSRLVVLQGQSRSGKSELLKILGEMWIRTWDYAAIYVDLRGFETSSSDILLTRMIASVETAGLDATRLANIDRSLGTADLCVAIRAALESVTSPDRLLLVLVDGMEQWEPNIAYNLVLATLLPSYATSDSSSRVRVVVAEPPALAGRLRWAEHYQIEPIALGDFSRQDWTRAAPQFIRFHEKALAQHKRAPFGQMAWPTAGMAEPDDFVVDDATFAPERLVVIRAQRKLVSP
jgi:hypothetical protein